MPTLNSSAIAAVEYDAATSTLKVKFRSNYRWYTFYHVPERHYIGLIQSNSPGRYYNLHITHYGAR